MKFLTTWTTFLFLGGAATFLNGQEKVTVYPNECPRAISNPMKGFRVDVRAGGYYHDYALTARCYIRWNELENDEEDTIEKIRDYCNRKWKDVEKYNVKVIPRVYLDWDRKEGNEYWPADMQVGDYSSEQFVQRVTRLIERLGKCWDDDPRIAWIQMGIIGAWGEHHSPSPSPEIQKLLGEAFAKAFRNKKVLVRHPDEFVDYPFGIYWDSWAHIQQAASRKHGLGIQLLNEATGRWRISPIEGETAYNWGNHKIQPGDNPNDTLSHAEHREFLIDSIRRLHCTALGWVASYDPSLPEAREGAAEVQKAFGYRFVLKRFTCPRVFQPKTCAAISFSVLNSGSAPFYEKWPIELSLLDPQTRQPIWRTTLDEVDIRQWLPGDDWDDERNVYRIPAKTYEVDVSIDIPSLEELPAGEYLVALAILEPQSSSPNLRFAIENYFNGGRHPLCRVGWKTDFSGEALLKADEWDDPAQEKRIPYQLPTELSFSMEKESSLP